MAGQAASCAYLKRNSNQHSADHSGGQCAPCFALAFSTWLLCKPGNASGTSVGQSTDMLNVNDVNVFDFHNCRRRLAWGEQNQLGMLNLDVFALFNRSR